MNLKSSNFIASNVILKGPRKYAICLNHQTNGWWVTLAESAQYLNETYEFVDYIDLPSEINPNNSDELKRFMKAYYLINT